MTRLSLFAAAALACTPAPELAREPPVPTAPTVPTPASGPPATEDCADGADNDRDGLLDCEDADCQPECALDFVPLPTASASALTIRSRVTGGGALRLLSHTFQRSSRARYYTHASSHALARTWTATATALSGTATVSGSSSATPCTWWATGVRFGRHVSQRSGSELGASFSSSVDSVVPLTADASGVDAGCPVTAAELMAQGLTDSARWHFGATSSGSLVGRQWLEARLPYFPETVSWTSRHNTGATYDRFEEQQGSFLFSGSVASGEPVTWSR